MTTVIRRHIYPLLVALTACIFTGCLDDTFLDYNKEIGEGDANLRATVEFENLTPALDSRASGNAIGAVSNLKMVIYKVEGGRTTFHKLVECNTLSDYKFTPNGNSMEPGDAETGTGQTGTGELGPTGEDTDHADYTYEPLEYGRYKIYAVANVPDLDDDDCITEEKLKSMRFKWNEGNISANNAMFGYFTPADSQRSTGFDAPVILINSKQVNIHAWIKRLVSKVTVAFDPSGLKESVTVYIKSVTIHDIPDSCYLGKINKATEKELIANGDSIIYYTPGTEKDHSKWGLTLQRGSGIKGSHSNTADALYFFENMQGDYEGQKPYLKEQIPKETGTSIDKPGDNLYGDGTNDYKDRVKDGTYIEVVAYYESKNTERMSSGNIKYRFMLGKNVTYNYDAQRNYHFKLTLKLRGFANEADWHISYSEPTPIVYVPNKYYVSYLYGQESFFPVRIKTGKDEATTKQYTLKAEIIENAWWPYDDTLDGTPNIYVGEATNFNAFAWMKSAVENNVPAGVTNGDPLYVGDYRDFAGFLAVRKPEMEYGVYKDIEFPGLKETADGYTDKNYGPAHLEALKNYYFNNNVAHAAYKLTPTISSNVGLYDDENNNFTVGTSANGQYSVKSDQDGSVTLRVPFYTRPRKMVAEADFTGNNPYSSYTRKAVVKFTLYNEKGQQVKFSNAFNHDEIVDHIDVAISQVRRVENPKAIYRRWDNDKPFKITLMERKDVSSTTPAQSFTTLDSDGPWRATIYACSEEFVKLTTDDGQKVESKGDTIYGSTGSDKIEFTYTPKGKCASADKTRCAVILVEYNDYTCRHYIFLRQGYDAPVTLGGNEWSCYQVYATGWTPTGGGDAELGDNSLKPSCNVIVTEHPLSMGSLLKRCQYNYSITEDDNPGWLKPIIGELNTVHLNDDGSLAAPLKKTWGSIAAYGWRNYAGTAIRYDKVWADTWVPVNNTRVTRNLAVPTAEDYEALRDHCDFGFGIAYADGASETATSLVTAYEFLNKGNAKDYESTMGVRACIAYNKQTGDNILFPLGNTGNGRRTLGDPYHYGIPTQWSQFLGRPAPGRGSLSYGGVSTVMYTQSTKYRPILYNHFRTPGAVYWVKEPRYADGVVTNAFASWDINYFTLTFNKYSEGSIANYTPPSSAASAESISDALPIKLIYKKSSTSLRPKRKR